jgi:outer membrane protein OmpA-like peptidoglycan-associated protein
MRRWSVCLCCVLLSACAAPVDRITVLEAQPGESLTVTTGKDSTVLTHALSTAQVKGSGQVTVGQTTLFAAMTEFGSVVATLPDEARTFTFWFATGQAKLDATGRATLAAVLQEVQRRTAIEIEVVGHTDDVGSTDANDRLSLARAEAVRQLLWQGGVMGPWVRVTGRGSRAPVVHRTGQAEPWNRHVEVILR